MRRKNKLAEPRVYEVMLIVEPGTATEDVTKLQENIEQIITSQGGTIVKSEDMGMRRLAYEINHRKEGHYLLFEIEGSGSEIAELERRMRVSDAILRYLTVRVDLERKTSAKIVAKREIRRTRRASFRNESRARTEVAEEFPIEEEQEIS